MPVNTIRRNCKTCKQPRLFEKQKPNHVLHLLLSLVTCGIWLVVWFSVCFFNSFAPYRCRECGQAKF